MAQHATLAPPPHRGSHEGFAADSHHVLAASHHSLPERSGTILHSQHQPQPQQSQHQHQQQQQPQHHLQPQHSGSLPPPPHGGAPPRQAEFYPPQANSYYSQQHHHTVPSPHHIAPHPPQPSIQHTVSDPVISGPPQLSAGPSSLRTSPSAPNTAMDWPPGASASSSQDRRQSIPVGSGHRSQLPSPDPPVARRTSEILMQQQGARTSDSFLARATNEHLVMNDRPMARQLSDMGVRPEAEDGRVGVEDPYSERSYTEFKVLGDGSFGTVWLCDWHSPVKQGTLLSAMQCGAGARPEWAGKRLVALKRMKRVWEGGWSQAKNLGELVSLRDIPPHPAIIPLYDAFISPRSRELYFVFECMEGNLYQLTKSRKGRPLAAGLVASCFHQMVSGLAHVHSYGYFHRDMKPENLLVTTTGLCDYLSTATVNEINARRASGDKDAHMQPNEMRIEKDVQVIIKLADFGLARAISSKPPYTEYVSTRWYRGPEVLLRSTDYGAPVDMWALGTILAEMINLKPLFPGSSEIDQVYKICEVLGDPSPEYGPDETGRISGGGRWNTGIKLAKKVGFSWPKRKPVQLRSLFPPDTPRSLVDCIANLLRYNPRYRMTSEQCLNHTYFREVVPHLQRMPPLPQIPFFNGQPSPGQTPVSQQHPVEVNLNIPSRPLPPSHSHHEPHSAFANGDMRTLPPPESTNLDTPVGDMLAPNGHPPVSYFARHSMQRQDSDQRSYGASALVHQLRELDLPTDDLASYGARRWSEAELMASRHLSARYEPSTQGSNYGSNYASNYGSVRGSVHGSVAESNLSYSNLHSMSAASLDLQPHQHHSPSNPHVMAYVQQQQAYLRQAQQQPAMSQSTPNLAPTAPAAEPPGMRQHAHSTMALPLPSPPHLASQNSSKLGPPPPPAPGGKKKKWGLSSVFGGAGGKSVTSLPSVDEHAGSTTSLKRTQSGHYADERTIPPPLPSPQSVTHMPSSLNVSPLSYEELMSLKPDELIHLKPDYARMTKKEAQKVQGEFTKAKRVMADIAAKERARAVLNKRAQLINGRGPNAGEIEYSSVINEKKERERREQERLLSGLPKQNPSSRSLGSGYPASHASTSLQSLGSARSGSSSVYLGIDDALGRHKARKHTEEDDHSSIGRGSTKSRSMLSVATMDSDTGSRRSIHGLWPDPMMQAARRPHSNTHRPSNMTHSSASLESQLANQLQRQATVHSASESSLSLGRAAIPQRASVSGPNIQTYEQAYRMEPAGAYPHPAGYTTSQSGGLSRHSSRAQLPSIDDWPENPHEINPMFRVPPTHQQHSDVGDPNQNGLPPFATIAHMANSSQHHPQPPPHHPPSQ